MAVEDAILKHTTNETDLDFAGDDLAINFINTGRMLGGQLTDTLQSDNDVKAWLTKLEVPIAKGTLPFRDGVLLQRARELREIALAAVRDRKSGKKPSLVCPQPILGECSESCGTYDRQREKDSCNSCLRQRDGRGVLSARRGSDRRPAGEWRLRPRPALRRQRVCHVVL